MESGAFSYTKLQWGDGAAAPRDNTPGRVESGAFNYAELRWGEDSRQPPEAELRWGEERGSPVQDYLAHSEAGAGYLAPPPISASRRSILPLAVASPPPISAPCS